MRKKIKSPCIDVCKLKNDVCVGCGRTSYQIRNWSKFRSNKRDQIIQQLKSKNYSLNLQPVPDFSMQPNFGANI